MCITCIYPLLNIFSHYDLSVLSHIEGCSDRQKQKSDGFSKQQFG